MQFKKYPSYKNSGVEWLGVVPEHWGVNRFCYLFDENKKKNIGLQETNVLSLSYGNIKEKNINDNKGLLPESFETYQIIESNDIVFRFTDLQNDKRSLRSAISKYHGIITSAYIAVKTKQNADFYNYLFRAYDLQKVFYSMGEGMRQSLKMDELNKMPVVLPNKDEQKRIVSFLDTETARIDTLIAKQEKLIELLEEQRKSIISHAVTKGLNPNAPMKDSGVEWLGQVPEHWNISKLRYYLDGIKDGTHGTHVSTTEGQLLLSGKNIKNGKLVITDNERKISLEDHQKITANGFPKKGDLLINVVGTIGQSCIYELDTPISFQRSVCFLRANNKLKPNFLQRILESNLSQNQLKILTNKSTIGGVYMGDLVELIIPVVPIKEQNKITDYLDREIQEIVNCIDKQKLLIEKLKEYRSSIISHAVTGKIDVREFDA